jgi:hypothetical protein
MNMRALAGAFCLAILAASQLVTPAEAGPLGPRFCAQLRGGGENCGYYTFNQCLASISGVGGYCYVAPIQTQAVDVLTRRGLVRVYRDAID